MLVLTRPRGHSINIGDNTTVTVVDITGDKVKLGIDIDNRVKEPYETESNWNLRPKLDDDPARNPSIMTIHRDEVYKQVRTNHSLFRALRHGVHAFNAARIEDANKDTDLNNTQVAELARQVKEYHWNQALDAKSTGDRIKAYLIAKELSDDSQEGKGFLSGKLAIPAEFLSAEDVQRINAFLEDNHSRVKHDSFEKTSKPYYTGEKAVPDTFKYQPPKRYN